MSQDCNIFCRVMQEVPKSGGRNRPGLPKQAHELSANTYVFG